MKLSDLPIRTHFMDSKPRKLAVPNITPTVRRAYGAREKHLRDIDIAARERMQIMLEFIRGSSEPLTSDEVRTAMNIVHHSVVVKYLRKLLDMGLIARSDRMDKTYYYRATDSEENVL